MCSNTLDNHEASATDAHCLNSLEIPNTDAPPPTMLLHTAMLLLRQYLQLPSRHTSHLMFVLFVLPHTTDDLADSRDTLNRAPLRPPKLRKEARDEIADFPRERIPAPPSLRLEKPADVQLAALQEIGIPRRPHSI